MKLNINIFIKLTIVSFAVALLVPTAFVAAVQDPPQTTNGQTTNGSDQGDTSCAPGIIFPNWYDGLCENGTVKSPNDMSKGKATTADQTASNIGGWVTIIALNIVQMLLYVVGYVSIGFIIYGGFMYMTQGDSSSGTASARKTIQNAVIGLIISIMSVAIIKLVTSVI